jgi:hypothetical protein
MNKIEKFDFVDCLLIDFGVNEIISSLFIVVEAYYPKIPNFKRNKGLLRIIFSGISQIVINKNAELEFDISLPYDKNGNDTKANEIYSIEIQDLKNGQYNGTINSDMLKIEMQFENVEIIEIQGK